MVVTIVTSPHKKTGRVVPPKSTPVADKSRFVSRFFYCESERADDRRISGAHRGAQI
ncbi:GD18706 [Drosophila simulans]|uniref:GD18706 n=1 Tax=Drosophila simulans TaxID=7240 RepID=B4NVL3_DROSI|nr:GD18706 [Drosophila simulans]